MEEKIKVGISACLLGEKVRYDGGHKLDHYLRDTLGRFVEWVPICPEVECGLPVPREAMRLVGFAASPRLVTSRTGVDYTRQMREWAEVRLARLEKEGLCGFVFKSRSPSSGMRGVKVYGSSGSPTNAGIGIFAAAFMQRLPLVPVEDDGRLHDPALRENFIERVFVFRRWKRFSSGKGSAGRLVDFHTRHKLLVMSHSPRYYSVLGKLVAHAGKDRRENLHEEYQGLLMEGLRLMATVRKHVNVLQHMMGYFKKQLTPAEKREMLEVIEDYRNGLVPLVVPIVLLRHYVRKYDEPYLKGQYYLDPHPAELMLRNHV
ncbi:MAG: YbgA family protein [Acidobacteriota bacterium]